MGLPPSEAEALTLREIVVRYDSYLLDKWDHTAAILCMIHNLTATVSNLASKSRCRPKTIYDFHPYRVKPDTGLRINPKNMGVLKMIGNALARRR